MFSEEGSSNISLPYTLMGIIVLAVALVFNKVRLPEITHEEDTDKQGQAQGLYSGHTSFLFLVSQLYSVMKLQKSLLIVFLLIMW